MISKKYLMLFAVVITSVSSAYAVYENIPTLYVYHGYSQFQEHTFEEYVRDYDLTVQAEIIGLGVRVMPEVIEYHEDDHGVKQISSRQSIPKQEVTLRILDILDDKIGVESKTVVFYDEVTKALGKKDGQTAEFYSMYATDYHIGDEGIWHLYHEDGVFKTMGYHAYYPISKGSTTMTTTLDTLTNDPPINIESSKKAAKLLSSQAQD